jgi:hypothetical protein
MVNPVAVGLMDDVAFVDRFDIEVRRHRRMVALRHRGSLGKVRAVKWELGRRWRISIDRIAHPDQQ